MRAPDPVRARVISAGHTPLVKWGFPGLILLQGIGWVLGWMRVLQADEPVAPVVILYAVVCAALFPWGAWACLGLKRVALTDSELRISNFRREIVVPLRDVTSVGRTVLGMNAIVIDFARDTDFGRRIKFLPKRMFFRFTWTHPLVDRLRDAVAAAKAATKTAESAKRIAP
jgi:hypothetical protein